MRAKRTIIHTQDRDGKAIVLVPLASTAGHAKVLTEDYDALTRRGLTANWCFNSSGGPHHYVRCQGDDNLLIVARVLTGADRGHMVRYRDGDRRNLRRDNL